MKGDRYDSRSKVHHHWMRCWEVRLAIGRPVHRLVILKHKLVDTHGSMLLDLANGVKQLDFIEFIVGEDTFFFNYSDVISFGSDRLIFSVTNDNEALLARFQTQIGRNRGLASMELHISDDRDSTVTVKCANLKIVEVCESRAVVQLVFLLEWQEITTYTSAGGGLTHDTRPIIGR